MSTIELRSSLHELIEKVEDNSILKAVYAILEKFKSTKNKDWWDEISDAEKKSIMKGLKDIENDKVYSYAEVRRFIKDKHGI